MAITAAQRGIALDEILSAYTNPGRLDFVLPGVTAPQVLTALVGAIGANFDAQLIAVLNVLVNEARANLSATTAAANLLQNSIAERTVI